MGGYRGSTASELDTSASKQSTLNHISVISAHDWSARDTLHVWSNKMGQTITINKPNVLL